MSTKLKLVSPRTSTIPYTPTCPGWTSVHPRPLHPIRPHPDLGRIEAPALPSPPRNPIFHTTRHGVYRLSTHFVPAAFPRLTPDIPLPQIPPYIPGGSFGERRNKIDAVLKQVLEARFAYEEGQLEEQPSERLLWNCVNRYVRTSGWSTTAQGGVTLFLAHANGLHKETWETMLRKLLDTPGGEMVNEVWAWEAVQHGDAALANAESLSGTFDWLDNSRDIANFLVHYLPEEVEDTVLPPRLPRLPASVANTRQEHGYLARNLVVVGHSFGGCTSLRVAIDFPQLFSSFVLVDPIIHRPHAYRHQLEYLYRLVRGGLTRRERWSSRQEALELLQQSPFFGAWEPEVLRLYIDHALVNSEGGVRLKMSGLQEGLSFANRILPQEMWELLERLDERITLRWVVPEEPLSTKEATYERVWRRPANSTNIMFHTAGHLIVQEAPFELAHDVSDFLLRKYGPVKPHL